VTFKLYSTQAGIPRKIDDFTVEFTTSQPNPVMLDTLANIYVMNKAWCEKNNVVKPLNYTKKEETFATRNAMGASRPGGNWRRVGPRNSGRKRPSAGSTNPSHPQLQTNGMANLRFMTKLVASISAQAVAGISSSPRTNPAKQGVAKPGRPLDLTPTVMPPAANAAVSLPSP
jgi:peptide/nickel transport system substrate-binding protein